MKILIRKFESIKIEIKKEPRHTRKKINVGRSKEKRPQKTVIKRINL